MVPFSLPTFAQYDISWRFCVLGPHFCVCLTHHPFFCGLLYAISRAYRCPYRRTEQIDRTVVFGALHGLPKDSGQVT